MIRFSTYLVAIVLGAFPQAVGDWIMVDPGVRDTIEIGCPEFSATDDSIIMSVPISVWADEQLTGFMVQVVPGMANTTFRFVRWQDASPETPLDGAEFFKVNFDDRHEEYTSRVIISPGVSSRYSSTVIRCTVA